jgi:hypothetical protein
VVTGLTTPGLKEKFRNNGVQRETEARVQQITENDDLILEGLRHCLFPWGFGRAASPFFFRAATSWLSIKLGPKVYVFGTTLAVESHLLFEAI